MGIGVDPGQAPLEFSDCRFAQHVLDLLGVVMHVVWRDLGGMREVQLPQSMVPDNGTGSLPSGRCQSDITG